MTPSIKIESTAIIRKPTPCNKRALMKAQCLRGLGPCRSNCLSKQWRV